MTEDISKMTKHEGDKQDRKPAKEFFIVDILKKLLEINMIQYGTKKKF